MLICKPITWGFCENTHPVLVGLGQCLGFCISDKVKVMNDASVTGLWTHFEQQGCPTPFYETSQTTVHATQEPRKRKKNEASGPLEAEILLQDNST